MRWAWSHILIFDPLSALRWVTCPTLGVFGQDDLETDAANASMAMRQALLAARATETLLFVSSPMRGIH
jgi:pimeloyl-ACP methyl ester carboxylesterase